MPKKTAHKVKHQSFKLTPHSHPKERVILYILVAALVGLVAGWVLKDQIASAVYSVPMMGY